MHFGLSFTLTPFFPQVLVELGLSNGATVPLAAAQALAGLALALHATALLALHLKRPKFAAPATRTAAAEAGAAPKKPKEE